MDWIIMIVVFLVVLVGSWFWGKASDPKQGGAVGCCHCGQCIATGECTYRRNLQAKMKK